MSTHPSERGRIALQATLFLIALGLEQGSISRAQAEPLLVSVEAQAALPLTPPQSQLFGPGAVVALALHYPLLPSVLVGVRLRAGLLSSGDPPAERGLRNPGAGSFELAALTVRLRPLAAAGELRRATGLFIDLGAGGGVTGDLARTSFEAGVGYGLPVARWVLAATLRYLQVLQPTTALASDDARLLMLGVELTWNDPVLPAPVPAPPPPAATPERDHDGVDDRSDQCPDAAEDLDGYADADGCPDPDNDNDGVPDANDKCPNEPEDIDRFEDADGCPDPDNDHDTFLDIDDKCPNEAEVINGIEDYDGCPDSGLFVLENDRIVLEERVLFDSDRAQIKREVRPILRAIVVLRKQHPEWRLLRIEGHTDARGDAAFNQELSERRAKHVMQELIKLGLPASEVHAVGYGATRLRDLRNEQEAHQRNRRVEFVVEARAAAGDLSATDIAGDAPKAPENAKP